jgi:hypothetical protein
VVSSPVSDRSVVLRGLHYLGGHPGAPSELDRLDMIFDDGGIHFQRAGERLGSIPWDEVVDMSVDAESATRHMTVPRVWLLGVFAALVKKRERRVLLRVADRGGAWMFSVDGISSASSARGSPRSEIDIASSRRPAGLCVSDHVEVPHHR